MMTTYKMMNDRQSYITTAENKKLVTLILFLKSSSINLILDLLGIQPSNPQKQRMKKTATF
ncbi:hypothetical protein DW084_16155 [Enterococcus casseliflavus]|uniref:Uncharacterized protein n=1 Tax=Enterococcus casseliflavus TaxID=37734 RepID=A0A415ENT4_ENTCA|nr:hypothetical protein DW084_16155 [Enterococcus casseliflavus]